MAKNKRVNLYGYIESYGENTAEAFIERFDTAVNCSDSIDLHVHCYGGLVFEGNLIYNHVKKCPIPVDVYIDGVAASMGSVIALAGRKVYMSENAFYMTHKPQGGVYGTAADMRRDAKLLESMEKQFKKLFKSRTGRSDLEIEALLDGDNWFSAEQALDFGFIDGVVDVVDVVDVAGNITGVEKIGVKAMFNRYTSLINIQDITNMQINNNQNMDKKAIISKFGLTAVTDQSSDTDIMSAIEEKLQAERSARENLEGQLAESAEKQIDAVIVRAKSEGKVTEAQESTFRKIAQNSGIEVLNATLEAIGSKTAALPGIASRISGGKSEASGRECWDWDMWQKEDPQALVKMPYEQLNALYKARYGVDAPNS